VQQPLAQHLGDDLEHAAWRLERNLHCLFLGADVFHHERAGRVSCSEGGTAAACSAHDYPERLTSRLHGQRHAASHLVRVDRRMRRQLFGHGCCPRVNACDFVVCNLFVHL